MRISDWSAYVCSSDLQAPVGIAVGNRHHLAGGIILRRQQVARGRPGLRERFRVADLQILAALGEGLVAVPRDGQTLAVARSEERRVGKEWVSTCRIRWALNN